MSQPKSGKINIVDEDEELCCGHWSEREREREQYMTLTWGKWARKVTAQQTKIMRST